MPRFIITVALTIITVALALSSFSEALAQQGGAKDNQPPDLSGPWLDHGGKKDRAVTLKQSNSTVVGTYDEDFVCDPRDGGPSQTTREDFTATLTGTQLEGEITVCSWGKGNKLGTGLKKTHMKLT